MESVQQRPGVDMGRYFRLREIISTRFDVEDFYVSGETIRFGYREMKGDFASIRADFRDLGYHPYLKKQGARQICILVPGLRGRAGGQNREKRVALALFLITLVSTTWAGREHCADFIRMGLMHNIWLGALEFSLPLILILGAHELAHKWAAMRNGIDSTPPYFIPFPSIIGTMGAVIRIKSPTPDKNAAVALGVSGPLVGFLITLPVLALGLYLSPVVPVSIYEHGQEIYVIGNSLLFRFLIDVIAPEIPRGYSLLFHPLAVAGWVGLFVTGLNLIPMGQLDGGHISRAMLGQKLHNLLSRVLVAVMFAAGAGWFMAYYGLFGAMTEKVITTLWPGWLIWGVFGYLIVRRGYPRTLNEEEPLSLWSKIFSIIAILILILCFIPNPIMVSV